MRTTSAIVVPRYPCMERAIIIARNRRDRTGSDAAAVGISAASYRQPRAQPATIWRRLKARHLTDMGAFRRDTPAPPGGGRAVERMRRVRRANHASGTSKRSHLQNGRQAK